MKWPTIDGHSNLELQLHRPRRGEHHGRRDCGSGHCGPDPEKHIEQIRKVVKAGADHVYIHQVGKDQEGFLRFYERHVLPEFGVNARRAA